MPFPIGMHIFDEKTSYTNSWEWGGLLTCQPVTKIARLRNICWCRGISYLTWIDSILLKVPWILVKYNRKKFVGIKPTGTRREEGERGGWGAPIGLPVVVDMELHRAKAFLVTDTSWFSQYENKHFILAYFYERVLWFLTHTVPYSFIN